jgi:hypothetical protein
MKTLKKLMYLLLPKRLNKNNEKTNLFIWVLWIFWGGVIYLQNSNKIKLPHIFINALSIFPLHIICICTLIMGSMSIFSQVSQIHSLWKKNLANKKSKIIVVTHVRFSTRDLLEKSLKSNISIFSLKSP